LARENWVSRIGFVLAAAGSAVGLGNIWRFPYVAGEGGGAAWIIVYLIMVLIIGYPIMVTEISLGRASNRNVLGTFKALAPNTPWWLVGALGVLTSIVILSYYSVIGGWSLAYVFQTGLIDNLYESIETTDELFGANVGQVWAPIIWQAIFMVMCVGIIAAGVVKGIQRWVQYLWPVMGVLLIVIVIRGVTLPGASEGLEWYLVPDFSDLTAGAVTAAMGQVFFTLSLAMGIIITYGSYFSKKDEIPGSAGYVVGLDTAVAIIAGFAIFPAVFAMGFDPGHGAGLAFVTLPAIFAEIPVAGELFGTLFFILLSAAALTSAISILEVSASWLIDEYNWARGKAAAVMGVIIFIIGVPTALGFSAWDGIHWEAIDAGLLDIYDFAAYHILLPVGALFTAIFAGHIWGAKKVQEEANHAEKPGSKIGNWFIPLLKYVLPIIILIFLVLGFIEQVWPEILPYDVI